MKPLSMWSEIEIKAGIYDRQNEIAILQNELRVRASQPVKPVEEKVVEENAILEDISLVSKAIRVVQMKIYESGFMEKLDDRKERDGKNKKMKVNGKK
jgi:hypothetical protein